MSKFEFNKIAGAILFTILVVTAIRLIGNGLFETKEEATPPAKQEAAKQESAKTEASKTAAAGKTEGAKTETASAAPTGGDPAAGEKVFKQHLCFGCHKVVKGENGVGPSLYDVYGRNAGEAPGYDYSDALKNSGITWTPDMLNKWVQGPHKVVANTKMVLAKPVTDPTQRANLIAFLKAHSEQGAASKPEAAKSESAKTEASKAEASSAPAKAEAAKTETASAAPSGGDPAAGEKVFKAHLCFGCHKVVKGENGVGPSLYGVYGRKAGEAPGYSYSDALKNSGITWTPDMLNKWVQGPQKVVPDTKMVLVKPVTDPTDRENLIAFLKAHSP